MSEMTTGTKAWATVVVVGILSLGALSIIGNGKSESSRRAAVAAETATRVVQQNTARTECIRGIAASLDHARWALVGRAFNTTTREQSHAIGMQLNNLPLITDLAERGGKILGEPVDSCPPVPLTKGT